MTKTLSCFIISITTFRCFSSLSLIFAYIVDDTVLGGAMNRDNQSSLKELHDLFVKYNTAQIFYSHGNGCCFSFIVKTKDIHYRSIPVGEILIHSGLNCLVIKDTFRNKSGEVVSQKVEYSADVSGNECDVEISIGSLAFTIHLF